MDFLCNPFVSKVKGVITAEALFRPAGDGWSHADFYKILCECENIPCLKDVYLKQGFGGLNWKPSEESMNQWLCNDKMPPVYQSRMSQTPRHINFSLEKNFETYGFVDWKEEYPPRLSSGCEGERHEEITWTYLYQSTHEVYVYER
jgi:hypothetical protein